MLLAYKCFYPQYYSNFIFVCNIVKQVYRVADSRVLQIYIGKPHKDKIFLSLCHHYHIHINCQSV